MATVSLDTYHTKGITVGSIHAHEQVSRPKHMESCIKLAKVAFLQLFAIRKNFWRESNFFRYLSDNFLLSCVLRGAKDESHQHEM